MTREAAPATWFPDDKIDAGLVSALSQLLQETARINGFTRETYCAAIAQMADGITGIPPEQDIDIDVRRFVGERLLAAGTALTETH